MLGQMNLGDDNSKNFMKRKESQCSVCCTKKRRRKARIVCARCNNELHGECFPKHRC
jgi:hypothetical protein